MLLVFAAVHALTLLQPVLHRPRVNRICCDENLNLLVAEQAAYIAELRWQVEELQRAREDQDAANPKLCQMLYSRS